MAIISGAVSTTGADVDTTPKALRGILYDPAGNVLTAANKSAQLVTQYGMPLLGSSDDQLRLIATDLTGRLGSDTDVMHIWEPVEGTTLNSQRWTSTLTTQTVTQSATNGITLNGSAITTINTGSLITSQKAVARNLGHTLRFSARIRATLVTNQVGEWGIAQMGTLSATTAQIDNGAFWRFTGGGSVIPVLAFGGSDVNTGVDISGSLANTNYYTYDVILDDDRATYICTNSATGAVISEQVIRVPLTQGRTSGVTHLNAWARCRNGGSAPASAGQVFIGELTVVAIDDGTYKGWQHQLASNAMGGDIIPTTYAQAQQFANSAAAASATLSNTTAGYGATILGGIYQYAAVAGAATDYSLFSYAVPAPYSFYCEGARITMINTGAANAATPATTNLWGIGSNGASANLATGGHIRTAVGTTSIPINAAIGVASTDLDIKFNTPLVTNAGRHITVIMRVVAGAATASQVIVGSVSLFGYNE